MPVSAPVFSNAGNGTIRPPDPTRTLGLVLVFLLSVTSRGQPTAGSDPPPAHPLRSPARACPRAGPHQLAPGPKQASAPRPAPPPSLLCSTPTVTFTSLVPTGPRRQPGRSSKAPKSPRLPGQPRSSLASPLLAAHAPTMTYLLTLCP